MNRRHVSRASLFLLEMIFTIFFMALTSVVCVRMFIRAHDLSKESTQLLQSSSLIQTVADAYIAADADPDRMNDILKTLDLSDLAYQITPLDPVSTDAGTLYSAQIQVFDQDGEVLDEQIIKQYVSRTN